MRRAQSERRKRSSPFAVVVVVAVAYHRHTSTHGLSASRRRRRECTGNASQPSATAAPRRALAVVVSVFGAVVAPSVAHTGAPLSNTHDARECADRECPRARLHRHRDVSPLVVVSTAFGRHAAIASRVHPLTGTYPDRYNRPVVGCGGAIRATPLKHPLALSVSVRNKPFFAPDPTQRISNSFKSRLRRLTFSIKRTNEFSFRF